MYPPNIKIYLGLGIILLVLFILVIILPFGEKSTPRNNLPTNITSTPIYSSPYQNNKPTKIQSNISPVNIISPTIIIPPTGFTGVKEEDLPYEIKTLSEQKQLLKSKLPITDNFFSIEFNYEEDKFIVKLNEPKGEAKVAFEDWLKKNYPAIPWNRFIFQ